MAESDAGPWLVVGLGNPGTRYAGTWHNVGAMVLDLLATTWGGRFGSGKVQADVLATRTPPSGSVPGVPVVLAKPRTYMNVSGGPVAGLLRFYKIPPERLLVVHDELDLPLHAVRLKRGGGEGGHNGLRSISSSIGTKDYCRVRLGIGRPPGRMDAADYVLSPVPASLRTDVEITLRDAADAVVAVLEHGWDRAQNSINTVR